MANWRVAVFTGAFAGMAVVAMAEGPAPDPPAARQEARHLDELPPVAPRAVGRIDSSGRKQQGRASYYSRRFDNRKMADGRRMSPHTNVAASKTLPLGTVATVTNLQNGKNATVTVEDRGPYGKGRVVDVSPAVATELDIKKDGVVSVEVKPIIVPQPDGALKLGAGAAELSPAELTRATDMTNRLTETKPTEATRR